MKYRIIRNIDDEFDVITEDGGVASVHHNGFHLITTYYQTRLTDISGENVWDELSDGEIHLKDWEEGASEQEIIKDALDWLVAPSPETWEIDETLFVNLIPSNIKTITIQIPEGIDIDHFHDSVINATAISDNVTEAEYELVKHIMDRILKL